MAIELVRAMTVEEYLDLEEQSEFRHEFIYGERYEMPGGTSDHEDIIVNILRVFLSRLDRSGFTVRGSGMRVLIDEENAILPDVSVVIGASELAYGKRILLNPAVVVEVLSKSSITHDRVTKRGWYLAVPSIQHYLIIDQFSVDVELLTRAGDAWHSQRFIEMADVIRIDALECDLPLADVYDRITFTAPE